MNPDAVAVAENPVRKLAAEWLDHQLGDLSAPASKVTTIEEYEDTQ